MASNISFRPQEHAPSVATTPERSENPTERKLTKGDLFREKLADHIAEITGLTHSMAADVVSNQSNPALIEALKENPFLNFNPEEIGLTNSFFSQSLTESFITNDIFP